MSNTKNDKSQEQLEEAIKKGNSQIAIGCIAIIIFIIFLIIVFSTLFSSNSKDSDSNQNNQHAWEQYTVGKTGYLNNDGEDWYIAKTKDDLLRLNTLIQAKDNLGLNEMLQNNEVFLVNGEVKLKILQWDSFLLEIRILNGTQEGKSGWIVQEALKE